MKEYVWVGAAYEDLRKAKQAYRYWQLNTEILKRETYDPYYELSESDWEMEIQRQIADNRYELKRLENKIRELHKVIKKMNKQQNEIYGKDEIK